MQRTDRKLVFKGTVAAAVAVMALMTLPQAANAAGMGKITVLSALGQPLRAELEVTATRDELASLSARVASIEAFRQANVEYASVLSTLRFTLEKYPDGRPYFEIHTDRPVNDPFIDLLVELNWSSGRLLREYAFLIDPADLKVDNPAVVSSMVQVPIESMPPPAIRQHMEPTESTTPLPAKNVEMPPDKSPQSRSVVASETGSDRNASNTRAVVRGDTLSKIAAENALEGVTLDQMLVAFFNANRDAFDGANMNRLRAGKILAIPDASEIGAVDVKSARKTVVAQSADFDAYRGALADAAKSQPVAVEPSQSQSSAGKIAPKVEDKAPALAGKDKLHVSRSENGVMPDKSKVSEEDSIARDKALKEANERAAALEKNLTDLKKLAELKSQAAIDAQKVAQGDSAAAKPETAGGVPGAEASTAATPDAVASAAVPPTDEKPKPKAKPPKKPAQPQPKPEPGFIADNPLIVYGGGAGIAAVLGFLGFRVWKRRRDTAKTPKVTASDLAASSVFGASTNKNINTSASAPSDFSHSTFDAVDASKEGVDPIQEAEVYMAYGRDGQAEEILRDAMQKDPGNLAVYLKLLEIYVGRKSVPQFNDVAGELHARSSGTGPQWEKAAELGRSLDPSNPLYGGSSRTDEAHNATVVLDTATEPESDPAQFAATQVMSSTPAEEPPAAPEEVSSTMDFDLDLGAPEAESRPAEPAPAQEVASDIDFDLDLGGGEAKLDDVTASGVDINFDEPAKEEGNSIDFNFDLGDSGSAPAAPAEAPLDLSSINLDLTASSAPGTHGADASVVATKLELAQAYEEMGDREGARELLQEVLAEGSPEQQETARTKLAALA